jgi:ribosome-associated protein
VSVSEDQRNVPNLKKKGYCMEEIKINTEYIKLDQLLKFANAVDGGGMAKMAILEGLVKVNGEVVLQRGKKLREGDIVEFNNKKYIIKRYGDIPLT